MDGFEIVTQAQIHAIVQPLVSELLTPDEFQEVDILRWVRSVDAPIRQVFRFSQWKGGGVAPTWGVSLDFVPHVSGGSLKWHRTAKSAVLDLVVDARDESLDMTYHHGQQPIKDRAPHVVTRAVAQAREFWDRSRKISDLPNAFAWLRSRLPSLDFYTYTQHPLAFAFVCAMNGRPGEATIELERFLKFKNLGDDIKEKLHHLLAAAEPPR